MSYALTSRDDMAKMKLAFNRCIDALEQAGHDRGAVGAAMIGFGAGIMAAHRGNEETINAMNGAVGAIQKERQ